MAQVLEGKAWRYGGLLWGTGEHAERRSVLDDVEVFSPLRSCSFETGCRKVRGGDDIHLYHLVFSSWSADE